MHQEDGLRQRVTRQGEETIGKLAQELLESPLITRALSAAFGTRERASRAQELAMGALNLPSANDLERLTRRLRSVSQRLEAIEDSLDRLDERLGRIEKAVAKKPRPTRGGSTGQNRGGSAGQKRGSSAGQNRGSSAAQKRGSSAGQTSESSAGQS